MMRAPPPVVIDLSGSRLERALHVLLPALAGGALAAWAVAWLHDARCGLAHAVVAALAAVAGGALGAWLHAPVRGRLAWDGRAWSLAGQAGRLQLLIDAGPWLALRFRPLGAPRHAAYWFIASRHDAGAAWHALRAAVYCPVIDTPTADRTTAPPDRPA
jgi:hypothetical protein